MRRCLKKRTRPLAFAATSARIQLAIREGTVLGVFAIAYCGGVGHWWLLQLLVPAHYVMITSLVYFAICLIVLVS